MTKILLKYLKIEDGNWGMSVVFGLKAAHVPSDFNGEASLSAAAIVPIVRIGIQEIDPSKAPMTVDASSSDVHKIRKPTSMQE